MKILGFEADGGWHLGVLEGDELVDLQAVDKTIPGDLGEVLRRHNGDLSSLRAAAKRAPSTARRPLKGLKLGLPVARPGKIICLGLNYLEHVKEGSTVIDVGINKVLDEQFARELFDGEELERRLKTIADRGFTLVGDVNPKEAIEKAANFTPVPGGVGLLTVAMLMKNTVIAAKLRRGI